MVRTSSNLLGLDMDPELLIILRSVKQVIAANYWLLAKAFFFAQLVFKVDSTDVMKLLIHCDSLITIYFPLTNALLFSVMVAYTNCLLN
jgi:hypothetical protein